MRKCTAKSLAASEDPKKMNLSNFALNGKLNFKSWLNQRAAYGSTTAVRNPHALHTGTLTNAIVLQILDDTVNLGLHSALPYAGIIPTDFVHVYTKKSMEVHRTETNTQCL